MAAARDQAARILRPEPDKAESGIARDVSEFPAEQAGSDPSEETVGRRPAEAPDQPALDQPGAAPTAAVSTKPKSGKRKLVLMGIVALLALAAASYGGYYVLVGRFYVSTDDAYVRANNTMLGARVSGHIAAILPGDNVVVRTGDVIFRIDEGDYRIAVDAARSKIATQQATIDRIGRQVTAQERAVEQA
jgi:membrane fusion protein (multidrug efflux system)